MIDLQEVAVGDEVTIQDGNRNLVVGVVKSVEGGQMLAVEVFGHDVTILRQAQRRKPPHTSFWAEAPGVRVVGHLPAMF